MSRLAVFDVDGTILDSFTLFEKVLADYSRGQGLPAPCFESVKAGYGDPGNHDFKWGIPLHEQERHLKNAFRLGDRLCMSGHPGYALPLFAGVEETLRRLKDWGHTLAIVTSRREGALRHFLDYHDIGKMFSAIRVRDDIARRGEREKPAPDQLASVMKELDFGPGETIMIGDSTMDMQMGRAAQAHTIGVTWGTHPKSLLLEAGADHIVETRFDDVVPVIQKL